MILRSGEVGVELDQTRRLVLFGQSYRTAQDAEASANRWRDLLQIAFARSGVGADFGDRAPKGAFTKAGLGWISEQSGGVRVLNDDHGIAVFECEPPPRFARQEMNVVLGKSGDVIVKTVRIAQIMNLAVTDQQRLAYDLYSASFSQPSADARFVMLAMALETLIAPVPGMQRSLSMFVT